MGNIWFLLWVFLAIFIFGLFFWSFQILLRQKRAWAEFAKKNNLALNKNRLFASSSVSGSIKGYPFYLYSEEQLVNQSGNRRFRTILQFELPAPMPAQGIIASPDAANFAKALRLKDFYKPEFDGWNPDIAIFSENLPSLMPYFTEERLKSLNTVMTIKSIPCIMIFDDRNTYLRFETADPFDNAKKLDRFVAKAVEQARILAIELLG